MKAGRALSIERLCEYTTNCKEKPFKWIISSLYFSSMSLSNVTESVYSCLRSKMHGCDEFFFAFIWLDISHVFRVALCIEGVPLGLTIFDVLKSMLSTISHDWVRFTCQFYQPRFHRVLSFCNYSSLRTFLYESLATFWPTFNVALQSFFLIEQLSRRHFNLTMASQNRILMTESSIFQLSVPNITFWSNDWPI